MITDTCIEPAFLPFGSSAASSSSYSVVVVVVLSLGNRLFVCLFMQKETFGQC